ncbi:MAG: T9SS type A sorting domain-containing protein [Cryomorphaceae bacterium]
MLPQSIHSVFVFPLRRILLQKTLTVFAIGLMVGLQTSAQCLEITTSPEAELFCPDEEITLTASDGFESYTWYYDFSNENSDGTLYEETDVNTLTLNASEWAVTYWYVETDDPGCTEPSPTVVWDGWIFAPIAISHDENTTLCPGDSSLIENAFNGPASFQWFQDFAPIPNANDAQYWVTETGFYTLEASYPQCPNYWLSSGVGPEFDEYNVVLPEIDAQTIEDEVILSIDFGNDIQWFLNGVVIDGANELTYAPSETGIYTVTIVDQNGCNLTSGPYTLEVLSSEFAVSQKWLVVFPNPFSDQINISASEDAKAMTYRIFDLAGERVRSGVIDTKMETEIRNLKSLLPGVYVLELLPLNEPAKRIKLVKQ